MTKTKTKTKPSVDSITAIVRRCDQENPKPEDLKLLREHLDQNDALVRWNESSEYAFNQVIKSYSKSALTEELFKRQIKAKRQNLDYDSATATVKMLIDQVILCHIRLTAFESFHATKVQESLSLAWHEHYDKMLTSYQRRFNRACESLAKVRKLLSEADLADQKARRSRSQATLDTQRLYQMVGETS